MTARYSRSKHTNCSLTTLCNRINQPLKSLLIIGAQKHADPMGEFAREIDKAGSRS